MSQVSLAAQRTSVPQFGAGNTSQPQRRESTQYQAASEPHAEPERQGGGGFKLLLGGLFAGGSILAFKKIPNPGRLLGTLKDAARVGADELWGFTTRVVYEGSKKLKGLANNQ